MKTTKKEYFAILSEVVNSTERADKPELLAFIAHEIELLSKRAETKKPTKNQRANEEIKVALVNALTTIGEPITISELQARVPTFANMSSQKLSPLLHALEADGAVTCAKDKKRRTVFGIPQ